MRSIYLCVLIVGFGALCSPANAACTSPATGEGGVEYFTAGHTYKVCTGTVWVNVFCQKTDVTSGLLAHWLLDESSGTSAAEPVASHTGTLTNGPTWSPTGGNYFGALSFDGADDVVSAGSAAALDNIAALTVTAWIRPTSAGESNRGAIIGKSVSGTNLPDEGWRFGFSSDATNALLFAVDHDSDHLEAMSVGNPLTLSTWNFVAATWSGGTATSTLHIYVNGVEVSYDYKEPGAGARVSDAAANLLIGNNPGGNSTFAGLIDDVRIYNRVLTGPELATLASGGTCTTLGACSAEAQVGYDSGNASYKYCDATNWVAIGANSTGWIAGACSAAGQINYDFVNHALVVCNGVNWIAIGK